MFASDQYQLIDFGQGRKLERFGPFTLDRPSPAAEAAACADRKAWLSADARYERTDAEKGRWIGGASLPDEWTVEAARVRLGIKRTPFGHLGVFPEQAPLWDWIAAQVTSAGRPLRMLNLFAYTGGSTLAAAAAGAEVVHVDAAANTVAWARQNAAASGLAEAPIRWIVEDAAKFAARELKRGRQYDAIVLDPPTYGHGPKGQTWQFDAGLPPLLEICGQLLVPGAAFLLLTNHTAAGTPADWAAKIRAVTRHCGLAVEHGALALAAADARTLPSGTYVRAERGRESFSDRQKRI